MTIVESPTSFDAHLLRAVDDFLQTVVVVDDQALGDSSGSSELDEDEANTAKGAGLGRGVRSGLTTPASVNEHDLDPKAVTDAFAEAGLVCALLSPKPGEEIQTKFLRAAKRADLIVMDWVLNRDNGTQALALIRSVLASEDRPERRRLRTIAVYTGQKDLPNVAARVRRVLKSVYHGSDLVEHDDGLTMVKGPVRVAVFAKEHVLDLPPHLETRRVAFADLPQRLRAEFASLTNGLVTTVGLSALAALREDTHRVLDALGPSLDAAYLGHRSALTTPDDARAHAVALVAAEIKSVIEDNDVGSQVGLDVLRLWLADRQPTVQFGALLDPGAGKKLTLGQVEAMLELGLGDDDVPSQIQGGLSKKFFTAKVKPAATRVFVATEDEAVRSDDEFAFRMMMRTIYSQPRRILTLGTIVRNAKGHVLCVQPACDSVRLEGVRAFPFLQLEPSPAGSAKANYVVPDGKGGWTRLQLRGNPRDITIIEFDPQGDDAIEATLKAGKYTFRSANNRRYAWVAELKGEFAQRVAVDLAQQFAQVAVEEAELLRLSRRS